MIGKTNAGKGADNPIIVKNVSDIDKLLVKDNVGKVFKYVGETFYPKGQATPIVAGQPFEKLFVDTHRNPTVEEVYSWCDGGGSSGEPILFGVTSVSDIESGSSANIYLTFFRDPPRAGGQTLRNNLEIKCFFMNAFMRGA